MRVFSSSRDVCESFLRGRDDPKPIRAERERNLSELSQTLYGNPFEKYKAQIPGFDAIEVTNMTLERQFPGTFMVLLDKEYHAEYEGDILNIFSCSVCRIARYQSEDVEDGRKEFSLSTVTVSHVMSLLSTKFGNLEEQVNVANTRISSGFS